MTTEREALDRIAALCDEERWPNSPLAAEVRAILAEATPGAGDDRLADRAVWYRKGWEAALREAGVTLTPEEAALVRGVLGIVYADTPEEHAALRALAARLAAAHG